MTRTTPPKRLPLADVPRYVRQCCGQEVTRQTVYNWVKTGKGGMKLRTMPGKTVNKKGGPHAHVVTMTCWVEDFILQATEWR